MTLVEGLKKAEKHRDHVGIVLSSRPFIKMNPVYPLHHNAEGVHVQGLVRVQDLHESGVANL
jgi:hypothetical protein